MRIKKNDLTHYFIRPHEELPASYLKSCKKFFEELRATSSKRQATSSPQSAGIYKTRKDIYENK